MGSKLFALNYKVAKLLNCPISQNCLQNRFSKHKFGGVFSKLYNPLYLASFSLQLTLVMFDKDLRYKIALTQVEGIGGILFRHLIAQFGSAEEALNSKRERLLKITGIGSTIADNFKRKNELLDIADATLEKADKQGVELISYQSEAYPKRLKSLYDCPPILYYKGSLDLNFSRTVAIVGTRQATDDGKQITQKIVEQLKPHQAAVVSGLAYGIDIEAHKAAIQHQLPTLAVMASGIDVVYPAAHKKYVDEIVANGGILTENPFGMQPIRQLFLSRNRIIAGLSDAVVVVESAKKGGGLVTAEFANNYHRDVFAVPGKLSSKYSEGTNQLIKTNKAQIFTSTDDIIEQLNWDLNQSSEQVATQFKNKDIDWSMLTDEESKVVHLLKEKGDMQIDTLSWESGISLNRLASLLLNLEFQDVVKALPGKKFVLK